MKSILITGCNRGLGLGIVKQLVRSKVPPQKLIATCRNVEKAEELRKIADQSKNIHIVQLDVKKPETFQEFARNVEQIAGEDGLNVLFNNAGFSPKSTRINSVKPEQLIDTYAINVVGPIMLTKHLLPTLKKASTKNQNLPLGPGRSAIVNMSSILGSIAMNKEGGLFPYKCSKAAINMATKSLSLDLKSDGIIVTALHPGWVKTDMGGSNAPMSVEESCSKLVEFLSNLTEKHNGGFFQYDGKSLPW